MSTGALCTIISGSPGAGKTSLAVALLQEELSKNPDRPVYVMGVPELSLPHSAVPPVAQWTRMESHPDDPTMNLPTFVFPDGALIIVDEAQNVFRPRAQGTPVPPVVAAMERHRHKGLDFFLITQFPTLLDSNIRKLCGKHVHIRSTWGGRTLLEWSTVHDPESKSDRDIAASRRYKLPSKVFGLYKSSTKHVKQSRTIPKVVYGLVLCLVVGGFLGWNSWNRVSSAIAGGAVPGSSAKGAPGAGGKATAPPAPAAAPGVQEVPSPVPVGTTVAEYMPRINTRPETAPMYDAIRQVKSMPVVAGCVASATRCTCVNWQGTDAFLNDGQCREWIKHPPFDPWRERSAAGADGGAPAPANPVVASSAGAGKRGEARLAPSSEGGTTRTVRVAPPAPVQSR